MSNSLNSTDLFLEEVRKNSIPPTAAEELELLAKIKTGDIDARNELIKRHLRFVVSFAKKYQYKGLPLLDIIQEAAQGMTRAAEKFDPSQGTKFISYSVWWMRRNILTALNEQGRVVRQPHVFIMRKMKVIKYCDSHLINHGCKPSMTLLKETFSISDEDVQIMLNQNTVSIDEPVSPDSGNTTTLHHKITDDSSDFDLHISNTNQINLILSEIDTIVHRGILNERDKNIFLRRIGYLNGGETETFDSLSESHGITGERVRQIFERTKKKIRLCFMHKRPAYGYEVR